MVMFLIYILMNPWQWPMYGHNLYHTHSQEGKGAMTQAVVKWSYNTGNWLELFGPTLKDINGDGKLEIFFGNYDSTFYALNSDGSLLWSYAANDIVYPSPCIADVDGDNEDEIVFTTGYSLYVLNSDGSLLWEDSLHLPSYPCSPCIVDIDGNGDLEILFGGFDTSGGSCKMYALNHDGSVLWEYITAGMVSSSPCVADIDNDDSLEVIFGAYDSTLYVLNHDGTLLWSYHTNREIWGSPSVADLDGDGNLEIAFAAGGDITMNSGPGTLYVLRNGGSLFWSYPIGLSCIVTWASPCIADIDKSGDLEIIIGGCDSTLYVLNHDGSLLWEYKTNSVIHRAPSVADIDGDDTLEILVPQHRADKLYCLNHDGSLLWNISLGLDIHNLTIGDIDNDGCLEIAVGTLDSTLYVIDDPFGATNCSGGSVEEHIKSEKIELDFIKGKIMFSIPDNGYVDVSLYDISGRLVRIFFNKYLARGTYKIEADLIGTGVYFVLLKYNKNVITRKIVLF